MNRELLKGKIQESHIKMDELAKAANMDRSTLYRRLASDEGEFTIAEATAISEALKLSKRDVMSIFFGE
jgi:DNA-binding phage protein